VLKNIERTVQAFSVGWVSADWKVGARAVAASARWHVGLNLADVRFTLAVLKKDRHSELSTRVFNGTGRIVELRGVIGHMKFNAPNSIDSSHTGSLPTPTVRADISF
jgi:hypothetical protein